MGKRVLVLILVVLAGCVHGRAPENAPPGACRAVSSGAFSSTMVCDLSAWRGSGK